MAKKIFWVSRHSMNRVQMGALRRLFGEDAVLEEDPRPFNSAEDIIRRYREGGYDDIIVVAPYSVLDRMVQLGVWPLWSEAEQVENPRDADWSVAGRHYRFRRFRRVRRLVLEFDDLGPEAERRPDD